MEKSTGDYRTVRSLTNKSKKKNGVKNQNLNDKKG